MSMKDEVKRANAKADANLALAGGAVFDIPPRVRYLMLIAGFAGIVILLVECLVGKQAASIEVDKILHFSGFFVLSMMFVLSLRPILYIPALLGLAGVGIGIEFLQKLNYRSFDTHDMVADVLGVVIGGTLGMLIRGAYAFVRKDLAARRARRRLRVYEPGEVILKDGEVAEKIYIVRSGKVRVDVRDGDKMKTIAHVGASGVLGLVSAIDGEPFGGNCVVEKRTRLYAMDLRELIESADGHETPVAFVLKALAETVRVAAGRIADNDEEIDLGMQTIDMQP